MKSWLVTPETTYQSKVPYSGKYCKNCLSGSELNRHMILTSISSALCCTSPGYSVLTIVLTPFPFVSISDASSASNSPPSCGGRARQLSHGHQPFAHPEHAGVRGQLLRRKSVANQRATFFDRGSLIGGSSYFAVCAWCLPAPRLFVFFAKRYNSSRVVIVL